MGKLDKKKLDGFVDINQILKIQGLFPGLDDIKVSEGVWYVFAQGEAMWLIGSIATLQAKIPEQFQRWKVKVAEDLSAVLTCTNRYQEECFTKKIAEIIDFGLPELELIVIKPNRMEDFMIMLPREANKYYGDKIAPLL
ncbi:MAG: hypothetical protein GYA18_10275 [Chloroflexi bacterium]|nr:hypothetical protein [Chloroflexota bacterium]